MITDKTSKVVTKIYAKTLLLESGKLTKEIHEKIRNGDENTIRDVLTKQKEKLLDSAANEKNPEAKEWLESEAGSVQEVIDSLTDILSA